MREVQAKNLLITSGKLEDASLISVIRTLALEERSGILKIVTYNNSGKIYFRDGFIVHAQVGLHQGEEAALHMLFWHSGNYSFSATTVFDDRETIRLSLIGLLIIAERLRKEYLEHLQEIGSQGAIIQLKYKDDLVNSSIKVNEDFIVILERPVALSSALENSFYTCYQTAEKLSLLKKNGFLSITDPLNEQRNKVKETEILPINSTVLFDSDEEKQIRENLSQPGNVSAKIALFCSTIAESDAFMRKLVSNTDIIHTEDYSLIRVLLDSDFDINIYGLKVNEVILRKVEALSEGLSGIIFLIDCQKSDDFEYKAYVLRYCTMLYQVPWIAGFYNMDEQKTVQDMRATFNIPKYMPTVQFDPQDDSYIKEILLKLKRYEPSENEESERNENQDTSI